MVRAYFKTSLRNIIRDKAYSFLNILGLTVGMGITLLIGLWVWHQYSFDRFLPGYQQVYQLRYRTHANGVTDQTPATALPLEQAIKNDIPGVSYVVHTDWMAKHGLAVGDKQLFVPGTIAGTDFLKIFAFPMKAGNADVVLKDPYSIVLTESTAKALFGNEDPINKTVRVDSRNDLKVTGVLRDIPGNSTFQFNFLIPFSYYVATEPWVKGANATWENAFQTFVALRPEASEEQVSQALKPILKKYLGNKETSELFLQPMKDWHLYSDFRNGVAAGGLIDYLKMFGMIGLLVLLIACINFMNLSTARSEKRAREVGIRKTIGSSRRSLMLQFLTESILLAFIALIFSLGIVQSTLPLFNELTRSSISVPFGNPGFWLLMIGYVLFTGTLAGARPAFYFSSFKPVRVLKGGTQIGQSAILPRKILVTIQFVCSISLIISTIIIYQQIQHARNRPAGYDTDRLVITDGSADLDRNYEALKHDLLHSGVISDVTKASVATELNVAAQIEHWPGQLPGEKLFVNVVMLNDSDYFKTLRMQMLHGRNFTGTAGSDAETVILNEALTTRMRMTNPLNQRISFWGDTSRIVGVMRDALMTSPFSPAAPTIFVFVPRFSRVTSSTMYRLAPGVNPQVAIEKIAPLFRKYNPTYPYQYRFADDDYGKKFSLETLIGRLAALFAALAIFISCLGLFGLSAYLAEQRSKEIGIRKVLGASVSHIWLLLSKEFIVLVLISCVLATPISLYCLTTWLRQYDYRITIGPFVFIGAGIAAIAITIATISFQAIKAALLNPVKSLRPE